ncbi:MAG TPA: hypothetical protein DF712_15700, partial [Balneola sp.]|nr:hypothetical protein [Balneola sp.]
MPTPWDLGGGNNRKEQQNDNRGKNTPPPKGAKQAIDDQLQVLLSSPKAKIPEYLERYLSEENPSVRERFITALAKFRRSPETYFQDNPQDLELLRNIFRSATERQRLREQAEEGEQVDAMGLVLVAEDDTIQFKRTRAMRLGIILRGNETAEELDEIIESTLANRRLLREREREERSRQEAAEALAQQFEEGNFDAILDQLDEDQLRGGSYDLPPELGRPRQIKCRRQIGNTELDPITRFYNIATPFVDNQSRDIFKENSGNGMNMNQRVLFGKHLVAEARSIGKSPPNLIYDGNDKTISFERIIWSYGGYENPQMAVVTPNNAAVRGDTQRKLKWDSCWSSNGNTFNPINEDELVTQETRNFTNQVNSPVLLYPTTAGDFFGQKDVLNFPASMNTLADNAYPKINIEQFTEFVEGGLTLTNSGDSRIRKERMLDLAGYRASLNVYNGEFGGAGFLEGMEFYNTLLRNIAIPASRQEYTIQRIRFAALKPFQAKQISESTFVSYGFYNFTAHTGEARDLYGNLISETEGSPQSPNEVFGFVDPEYNYFSEQYENAIAGSNIPHLLLPNFYTYILASNTVLPSLDQGQEGPPEFLGGERQSTIRNQAVQQITLGEFSENI